MRFEFVPLDIPDVVLVRPTRLTDSRGFFQESYRESAFAEAGIVARFVQDNVARSTRNVLRGLHYQIPPAAQGKLVGAMSGRIFDVAVDLRVGATTFGRWVGATLDAESGELLWIPPGFAHGYVVLSDMADVHYKVTAEYRPELDRGVRWDDPTLGVVWPVQDPIVSEKDLKQPTLDACDNPFRIQRQ
jgi:dTDP-4-dehydrorhamnose 3,5-epimerase